MSNSYNLVIIRLFLGNAFVFAHLLRAFGRGSWLWFAIPWFIIMASGLFIRRWLSYTGTWDEVFGWIHNIWLPFGFFLLLLFVLTDIFFLLRAVWRRMHGVTSPPRSYAAFVKKLIVLASVLMVYGIYEAHSPRPVYYTMTSPKLSTEAQPLRLVFVTDIHINSWIGTRMVERVTAIINEQRPDIVLLGGDVVDADMRGRDRERELLRNVKARYGKFAVLGNHDAARGIRQSCDFLQQAGFTVLRSRVVQAGGISIAGVDDPRAASMEQTNLHDPAPLLRALRQTDADSFVLLLKHRPTAWAPSLGLFDLQLSGHSHGGQIWPARYVLDIWHNATTGISVHSTHQGESTILVSVGSGFARTPVRFLTPPEVVVIDLMPGLQSLLTTAPGM